MPSVKDQLEFQIGKLAATQGLRLYSLEYNTWQVRVFLDKKVGEGSVTLDECSEFSKAFSLYLDMDPDKFFKNKYTLEVSSPGVEKILIKNWHFSESVGKRIRIKTYKAITVNGKSFKTWEGILEEVESDKILLRLEDEQNSVLSLKLNEITKAQCVVFE